MRLVSQLKSTQLLSKDLYELVEDEDQRLINLLQRKFT